MTAKRNFNTLSASLRETVTANRRIPVYEQLIAAAAADGDDALVSDITVQYNQARGLPTHMDAEPGAVPFEPASTTDTTDTTGSDKGPYDDLNKGDLEDIANERDDLAVTGTGKNGFVTADDLRRALYRDDRRRSLQADLDALDDADTAPPDAPDATNDPGATRTV